ncbi:O-antigen ligase family protein [Pontiella sulfatireligans]|uniref:O-antigen ligase-related domain-containing protein n=1 Tax=Pontiella sulfatireligans TaxID=2750658 RepID=A0A6C2UDK9_9BACT|nr:O-antigen ligase family protein [Pontiella sulfatireligans]VGO18292.1 hypothetical protein SCARR_00344 [Pontiella sulfatireligans]
MKNEINKQQDEPGTREGTGRKNYLLACILMLIPVVAALFYGVAGDDKFIVLSPLAVIVYACLMVWVAREALSRNAVFSAPPAWGILLAFLAYGIMLVAMADIPFEARVRMLFMGLFIGAYGLWGNALVLFRDSRSVLGWLLVFALLASFYGLVNFFKQPEQVLWAERWAFYDGRLASTYICPNHFAHVLQMLLPFCLVLLFIPKAGIFLRILAGYCIVVFLPTMYFTESRAGMLGSIAALGVTVLLLALRKNKKMFVLLLVAVPLLSAILLVGAWNSSEMFKRRMTPVVEFLVEAKAEGFANTTTRDFRPLTWLDTIDMIKEKPATGFGPGSYWYAFPEYRKRCNAVRIVSGHPHNEYLEVASEYGLIGFGLLALAWVYGLVRLLVFSIKTPDEHHAFMAMAFLGTAAGTLLHSFFDFQMHVFQNVLVFALLAGIAVGPICGRRQEQLLKDQTPVRKTARRVALAMLAFAAVAGLLLSVLAFSSSFIRALGDRMADSKQSDKAIALYERAISIDASNWKAHKGLGQLYGTERYYSLDRNEKQELATKELAAYAMAVQYNPKDAQLLMDMGRTSVFLGDEEAGIDLLKQATQMRLFNDICWWNLGIAQRNAGRYEEALETFQYAATVKNSASIKKNIQWLEKQIRGDIAIQKADAPHQSPGVMRKVEDVPLDDLYKLLDAQ